jgi:hypothetical protein
LILVGERLVLKEAGKKFQAEQVEALQHIPEQLSKFILHIPFIAETPVTSYTLILP